MGLYLSEKEYKELFKGKAKTLKPKKAGKQDSLFNAKEEKENKFLAKKTPCNYGHLHDSGKEARRCSELHALQRAGKISNLEIQKYYLIIPALYETIVLKETYVIGVHKGEQKKRRVCVEQAAYYKADFVYYDNEREVTVIEDTKGLRTKDYILKRKLVKQQYCKDGTIFIET